MQFQVVGWVSAFRDKFKSLRTRFIRYRICCLTSTKTINSVCLSLDVTTHVLSSKPTWFSPETIKTWCLNVSSGLSFKVSEIWLKMWVKTEKKLRGQITSQGPAVQGFLTYAETFLPFLNDFYIFERFWHFTESYFVMKWTVQNFLPLPSHKAQSERFLILRGYFTKF